MKDGNLRIQAATGNRPKVSFILSCNWYFYNEPFKIVHSKRFELMYLELSVETKKSFEIADSKGVKGKSKGNGFWVLNNEKFEITEFLISVVQMYKHLVFNGFCDKLVEKYRWEKRFPSLLDCVSPAYREPHCLVFISVEDKFFWKEVSMVGEGIKISTNALIFQLNMKRCQEKGVLHQTQNRNLPWQPLKYKYSSNKNLVCCNTRSVLKITRSAVQDQKGTRENEEDREPEGDKVLQGDLAQADLLVNMDQ